MKINVEGYYFMAQAVSKIMIENKMPGYILNISSSSESKPAATPYKISKWAVRGMTQGLAEELLPYGIIVNSIVPGKTATPMLNASQLDDISCNAQPNKRYIDPIEKSQIATMLVSGIGNSIVGDSIYVSGGNGTFYI